MKVNFSTQWVGLDTLGAEEFASLRAPTEHAVLRAVLYFEGKVKLKLNADEPRTGRIYGDHQASAPGEAPAPLSGDLRKSITHTDVQWIENDASAEVGSNWPSARRLELGGVDSRGIRILPRPYFSAVWFEEEAAIQRILDEAASTHPVLVDMVATSDSGGGVSGRRRDSRGRFIRR